MGAVQPPDPTTSPTSSWDHIAVIAGGAAGIALGATDLYLKQKLTSGVDIGLIAAGLGALGIKGAFGGLVPR